jgi:hypothetical protein
MMENWAHTEMSGAQVWDNRCRRSLTNICYSLAENSGLSLSAALGSRLRQSAHRITGHQTTTPHDLLAGHRRETLARCAEHPLVLMVQDSTTYNFTDHKSTTGLGTLTRAGTRGLWAHSVVAVLPSKQPLGVLDVMFWTRDPEQLGIRTTCNARAIEDKESKKWLWGLECVEAACDPNQHVLLVQDREADIFAFLAAPRRPNTDLLIRACHSRKVEVAGRDGRTFLNNAIAEAPVQGTFTITVPRKPGMRERTAVLELRIVEVTALPPTNQLAGEPNEPQKVWVVDATEIDPPGSQQAISWTLLSTMPVNSFEEGRQIVEYYTCRWVIERLHYTIKSGGNAEHLQVNEAHRLANTLALYHIVAWRLMYVTYIARTEPESPASDLLKPEELQVLQQVEGKQVDTAEQAIIAVAKLGGYQYYRSAKTPGVKVLWIGLRKLEAMAEGWKLAMQYGNAHNRTMIQG